MGGRSPDEHGSPGRSRRHGVRPRAIGGTFMKNGMAHLVVGLVAIAIFFQSAKGADRDHCAICGKLFGDTIYTVVDKIAIEKLRRLSECAYCPDECYICGLPVRENPTRLADGRVLCARDARTA